VAVRRDHVGLWSPAIGAEGGLIAYGHHGRPVLVFPSEQGRCWDYEDRGMIGAVAGLIDAGRVKVYTVDSYDAASWTDEALPLEERAVRHGRYEDWILNQVVPFVFDDCNGPQDIITTGCSFGAFHAANFALRRADLFPLALCQSGVYDAGRLGWGERGDAAYFNSPMDYVANRGGDHLDWLRGRVGLVLVCGQGQWEDTTGALDQTIRFDRVLAGKGIRHETDLWGHDVPHDWPSWRNQFAHHLPRLV
jgi:esterase/lipase superfamily enzyme